MSKKYTKKKGRKKKTMVKRGGTPTKTFAQQTLASKSRNQVIPQLEKEKKEYPFEEYLKDVFEELYRDSYNETISERIADKKDVSQTMRTNMVQTMKDVMEDGMIRNKTYGHTSGWTKINNVQAYDISRYNPKSHTFREEGMYTDWYLIKYHLRGKPLQSYKDEALKLGMNIITERITYYEPVLGRQPTTGYRLHTDIFDNSTLLFKMSEWGKGNPTSIAYIAPGTPFELLKQKEIEGFEVEYDPIDK